MMPVADNANRLGGKADVEFGKHPVKPTLIPVNISPRKKD
jgi:hypothetical protein